MLQLYISLFFIGFGIGFFSMYSFLKWKGGRMNQLKRVNVFLLPETITRLNELRQKIRREFGSWYSVTSSDLIRFAIYKSYGIEFSSPHTSVAKLEEMLERIETISKYKQRG